jgi:hypothetical protein
MEEVAHLTPWGVVSLLSSFGSSPEMRLARFAGIAKCRIDEILPTEKKIEGGRPPRAY